MARVGGPKGETPGAGPIVSLDGDLDIVTSEEVKHRLAALVESGNRTVIVDMEAVSFVDSSGLGTLVAIHQLAAARGSKLVVRSAPDQVKNLFSLTCLDRLFSLE